METDAIKKCIEGYNDAPYVNLTTPKARAQLAALVGRAAEADTIERQMAEAWARDICRRCAAGEGVSAVLGEGIIHTVNASEGARTYPCLASMPRNITSLGMTTMPNSMSEVCAESEGTDGN